MAGLDAAEIMGGLYGRASSRLAAHSRPNGPTAWPRISGAVTKKRGVPGGAIPRGRSDFMSRCHPRRSAASSISRRTRGSSRCVARCSATITGSWRSARHPFPRQGPPWHRDFPRLKQRSRSVDSTAWLQPDHRRPRGPSMAVRDCSRHAVGRYRRRARRHVPRSLAVAALYRKAVQKLPKRGDMSARPHSQSTAARPISRRTAANAGCRVDAPDAVTPIIIICKSRSAT